MRRVVATVSLPGVNLSPQTVKMGKVKSTELKTKKITELRDDLKNFKTELASVSQRLPAAVRRCGLLICACCWFSAAHSREGHTRRTSQAWKDQAGQEKCRPRLDSHQPEDP